ncbi:S49 family peptidase [Marinobacter daepoensis]|uniref:S49 family peptidase n=1 Tax=Marinobacter daepoensis TaxID=262077 RepID=A0ABS3BCC9_9GAMM|nr:S49 family peptidase [Marinobacter daepoensis]MBN7769503.1 S49 family peptidase [Marinobacter daepoensis]MBY6031836.1 S49 family peptidase [Marinobacter daepoensis]MBY6078193.1 S49 family peptidase [Marinobacter daepoensis]
MSEWDSDKEAGWGDKPVEPEGSGSRGGLLGRRKPALPPESGRDWRLIEKLVMSLQAEQKRSRRWGIFFKLLTFGYLFSLLFMLRAPIGEGVGAVVEPHTALVEVTGPIAADELASADNLVGALRSAFEAEGSRAVVLRINSPGGSPVQSGYVYDEIKRLRAEYPDKKVYAVISDIGASGAYYIAAAADEIYANRASLVGSIGVVAGGFGFTEVMEKIGVDRRLYTAGENKAFLDPFSPEQKEEVAFWQGVLESTHQQFIEAVRQGRGDRLAEDPRLFSGLVWSGEQALELGLIDGLGSTSWVARQLVGEEELIDYSRSRSPFQDLVDQLGVAVGEGLATSLVESRLELR